MGAKYCLILATLLSFLINNSSWFKGISKNKNSNSTSIDSTPVTNHYLSHYQWGQLPIGGGGYVTGIAIDPNDKNIMYIRTDVGGAYRWDTKDKQWVQMLNWIGPDSGNLIGVDGMAIDPNSRNRIYLALGKNINGRGGSYRSEDGGKTWKLLMPAHYAGNGRVDRWTGECIAVDPNNSKIIYAGTRTDGLWRSTNDGDIWAKVADVPDGFTGTNPVGVRSIAFNPAAHSDGKSSIIYIGIPGTGIYRSIDGGKSFSLMTGSPTNPARMQVVNNDLFVTHSTGVALWSKGHWQDITPDKGKNKNYVGLAVDRLNNDKIIVAQRYPAYYNPIYRSENKGKTWEQINTSAVPARLHVNVAWWPPKRFSAATSSMAFVPGGSGALYYTDWFGVWYTPNVWKENTDWYTVENGHEETVVLTLVAPAKGALVYSGMADDFGFRHTSLNSYPKKKLYNISEGFSIAVCEKHPEDIAILGAKSWSGDQTLLATSSNYGQTWINRSLPAGSILGRIAISSVDPDNMVYVAGGGNVYYTLDKGNTWQLCEGAPTDAVKKTNIWNKEFVLAADCADNSFYLYSKGALYVSLDRGKFWTVMDKIPLPDPSGYSCINVVPAPGKAGQVWISLDQKGLWKTIDGGKSFSKISFFGDARLFSWGAPAPDNMFPTAYCYGTLNDHWGLYRSVDMGKTWVCINDNKHQFLGHVSAIAGDRQKFGQIYVGTGGNGIFYGQIIQ